MAHQMTEEDDWTPTFYIGQHESKRTYRVTEHVLRQAHDCNYDMLTTPITTPYFHSRVLTLLSNHLANSENARPVIIDLVQDVVETFPSIPPLSLVDTPLSPANIIPQLLAIASPWIDLCSPDPLIYDISRQVLELEVAYATFCGVENVLVAGPKLHHGNLHMHGVVQYARAIQDALVVGSRLQVHIRMPIMDHPDTDVEDEIDHLAKFTREEHRDGTEEMKSRKLDLFGTWDAWDIIRSVCKYHSRLFVDLSLPRHLPPLPIQSRWYSEPVRILSMTANSFIANPKGHPVLSKAHLLLITRFFRAEIPPWVLLCDVGPIPGVDNPDTIVPFADGYLSPSVTADPAASPTPAEASTQHPNGQKKSKDPTPQLSYIRHLQRKQPPRTPMERYGAGFQDHLQTPLQPLTDNLESLTYEVFEKDPVKYDLYEQAIRKALRDWIDHGKPTSSPNGRVVVAVAGAGRGPLVTRALRAAQSENVEIELWAVEKNPNAYVLLQRHNVDDWHNSVNVVQSDMRSWKGPWRADASLLIRQSPNANGMEPVNDHNSTQDHVNGTFNGLSYSALASGLQQPSSLESGHTPIDILISELLGSFGDNELSPECLDGIVHLLQPNHGISIPSSYTAYLTPIAAPRIHATISSRTSWDATAPETPAVVWLHAIDFLSLTPQTTAPTFLNLAKEKGREKEKEKQKMPSTTSTEPATDSPVSIKASDFNHHHHHSHQSQTRPPMPTPNVLPAWTFHHRPPSFSPTTPPPLSNTHNRRHAALTFRTRDRGVVHGLAGYFESVLYDSIKLSTNPLTMDQESEGMISWFPIYFPLRTPLHIPDHASLTINIWRQTNGRKVWYEWMVEAWGWNLMVGGEKKRVRLGASELMSSEKGGCLM